MGTASWRWFRDAGGPPDPSGQRPASARLGATFCERQGHDLIIAALVHDGKGDEAFAARPASSETRVRVAPAGYSAYAVVDKFEGRSG